MSGKRKRYDEEFKKNAVKVSYVSVKIIRDIASYLGVAEAVLYRWRQKYGPDSNKTRCATLEEENRALQLYANQCLWCLFYSTALYPQCVSAAEE